MKLATTIIRYEDEEMDKTGWLSEGGVFSVRTAYELQEGRSQEGEWVGWRLI